MADWLTVVVSFEEKEYPVAFQGVGLPIPAVKKLVIQELKTTRPNVFGEMVIDVDWLTLYLDQERTNEITGDDIPEGRKFYAKLEIPEDSLRYGKRAKLSTDIDVLTRKMDNVLEKLDSVHNFTKSLTSGELGLSELEKIRNGKCEFLFQGSEGEPPVLDKRKLRKIGKTRKEAKLDVRITSVLQELMPEGCVFVNSEHYRWLKQSSRKNTMLKPDGFMTHRGMYKKKPEPNDGLSSMRQRQSTSFHFGVAHEELTDCIVLFESKLKMTDGVGFGEVVRYIMNLDQEHVNAVLFDREGFMLIRSRRRVITKVWRSEWGTPGSQQLLKDFLKDSVSIWIHLLNEACSTLGMTVFDGESFLGRGGTGRVFKVELVDGRTAAVKLVVKEKKQSLNSECANLQEASSSNVVEVIHGYKELCNGAGACMVVSPVGRCVDYDDLDSKEKILKVCLALYELHCSGFLHGDPRLPNLIRTENGSLVWIDLVDIRAIHNRSFIWDFEVLSRSVLGLQQLAPLPKIVQDQIRMYAEDKSPEMFQGYTSILVAERLKSQ